MRMIMLFMKMKKTIRQTTKDDNDNNHDTDDNDNDDDNFAYDDQKTIWTQVTRMAMVKGLGVLTEVQVTEVNITETR